MIIDVHGHYTTAPGSRRMLTDHADVRYCAGQRVPKRGVPVRRLEDERLAMAVDGKSIDAQRQRDEVSACSTESPTGGALVASSRRGTSGSPTGPAAVAGRGGLPAAHRRGAVEDISGADKRKAFEGKARRVHPRLDAILRAQGR
jgi:hypothetical protein